ncbi:MAG: Molybdopterin adenylyltransferase [Candidatus Hydrogenedentes bacterium ADurb.Bin101]|nr:MAG: Molybdopterin adenylyltransferase [Candidatus Hydrogenedentes bacterium ADurb.Bin101]HOC68186.1 molybdopterin-binding protein [Candidatus Hydrogenedentota bacterium]
MTMENASEGIIVSVNLSNQKGTSKTPVSQIELNEKGVAGDAHAGNWHRQVSLMASESIERFGKTKGRTFSWGDFAENITTRGLDLSTLAPLDRLITTTIELEVTQIGKKCHGGGCAIYQEVGECIMPREGIFCRVLRGGILRGGDTITLRRRTLHCRVITLSDRAFAGMYQDRSGPRVCALLEAFCEQAGWQARIESGVLPDDAEHLTAALIAARDTGEHLVITTGGTGIGPRDITPEVVARLADKEIPGIMEYIRLTTGARKPNALLSRSVAAVLGNTLVYTLPGSENAVEEYLSEITKTLPHALYMINGLDMH